MFSFRHQHQPHAADGLDFDVCVSLEELAQLGDEDVEAARGEVVVLCVPAAAQDGFAAHGFIFVLGQDVQDVGFSGGQCLAFAGAVVAQGVACGIQRVGTELTEACFVRMCTPCVIFRTACMCASSSSAMKGFFT